MVEGEYLTEDGRSRWSRQCKLLVKAEEQRLVYGIVYEPDEVDAQGEFTDAEEIEKAAHGWMLDYQVLSHHHDNPTQGVRVVESYVTQSATTVGGQRVKRGAWVVVAKVFDDRIWHSIKEGELTGFSMGGTAQVIDEAA